jgi:hypothetical protein
VPAPRGVSTYRFTSVIPGEVVCRRAPAPAPRGARAPPPPPRAPSAPHHCEKHHGRGAQHAVRTMRYVRCGVIGTTFRELGWKTLIFFERAVPITPNAWYI